MEICMLWLTSWVLASANQIAYSFALRIFWNHGSLYAICRLWDWLYTPDLAMFPFPLPFGGMKDSFA